MNKLLLIIFITISFVFYQNANAQAELNLSSNLQCGTYTYCVDIELKANSGSFQLGTSSLLLKYDKNALTFDNYSAVEFDANSSCTNAWSPQQFDVDTDKGEFSLTMKLLNPSSSCISVDTATKVIGTICFTINQQGASPNISFVTNFTHLNSNTPDNGTNAITISALDSIVTAGELACDCPGIGVPCDDNNGFTTNDQYDLNCNCIGVTEDSDEDGIADGVDPCMDVNYEAEDAYYIGSYATNHIQYYGDGFIDWNAWQGDTLRFKVNAIDTGIHDIAIRYSNGGSSPRDLVLEIDGALINPNLLFHTTDTSWEKWDTVVVSHYFGLGQHDILLLGASNSSEPNIDRITLSLCTGCANAGQWCDDNDSCTVLDIVDVNCNCAGVLLDSDNDGVCDQADICANGNDNIDTDNDGTPDACDNCNNLLANTSCDDGDPCTINDVYDANCNCAGTATGTDSDNDGVCDAYDVCAGGDDNIDTDNDGIPDFCDACDNTTIGMPCDDGDPCTVLDKTTFDCGCAGIFLKVETTGIVEDVSCFNFNDGSINLQVANSFGDLTYIWDSGDSTALIENLRPGNYEVITIDFRNCKDTTAFVVTQPDSLMVDYSIVASADSNGSIGVTVSGGFTPYQYLWARGDTVQDLFNLIPYSYDLAVTDSNNCVTYTRIDVYPADMCVDTIIQAEDGVLHLMGLDIWNERYALGDGFIYLRDDTTETATYDFEIPADGFYTIGFRYTDKWASRAARISIDGVVEFEEFEFPRTYDWANWQKIEFVDYLTAGTHQLEIAHANDNWGPWIDFISICDDVVVPITLDAEVTDNICYGENEGSLTLVPTGGTRNYSILWSTGDTTLTIDSLVAGDYYVTATDEVGQMTIDTFTVGQPTEITPVFTVRDVKCNGETNGRADVDVTGGTLWYSYQWSNGQTWKSTYNVPAGDYKLTVTDGNGCIKISTVTINEPDTIEAFFANTVSTGSDGTIDMTVTGGNTPYTYFWKDSVTTEDRSNLAVGHYRVTITDTLNCKLKINTSIYPADICLDTIMEAEEGNYQNLNYHIWFPNEPVTGRGYIHFSDDSAGIANYTFDIAADGFYSIGFRYSDKWQDGKVTVEIDGIVEHLDFTFPRTYDWKQFEFIDFPKHLNAGTHTLTLKHRKNWSPRIDFIALCDLRLDGYTTQTDLNCYGDSTGTASVYINGGREPYQYLWNTGDTTSSITNLTTGEYIVNVTDSLGSVFIDTVQITQPQAISPIIVGTDIDCNGAANGHAIATVTGGTGGYTYIWNNNATTSSISNLNAGTYSLNVTDSLNCTATTSVTINEPAALVATLSASTDVSCHGDSSGTATISTIGGTGTYTYIWTNGSTQANPNNLVAGSHTVTVTDANGCTDNISITINQPTTLAPSIVQIQNVDCFGNTTGQITTNTTGGTGSYTYAWDNNTSNSNLTNVGAGTYTLSVTDANNCVSTISATVTEPTAIVSQLTNVTNVDCHGNANGAISTTTTGGAGNYSFLWSNGDTTSSLTNLNGGNYNLTITDANNCTSTLSATVNEPAILATQFSNVIDVNCFGNANGSAMVNVTGGNGNYSYQWNNNATTADIYNLQGGTYTIVVTDALGCTITDSIIIQEPTAPLTISSTITQTNGNDGSIDITTTGGTPNYIFNWSDGINTEDRNNLTVGNYSVTITDANGCSDDASFIIFDATTCIDDIYQAENATVNGANVVLNNANGSLGAGYTAFGTSTSETIAFDVSTNTDTVYEISVRYTQGTIDKSMEVSIDGNVVHNSLLFAKTANWVTWDYLTFKQTLTAGTHTIEFRNIQGNSPDMDYLSLCMTSPDTTTSTVTINNNWYQPALRPYPNPTTSNLNIDIELSNAREGRLTIYDVNGRMMYQDIIQSNGQAIITKQIDVEQYAQGLYFVQLQTALGNIVKKVTVVK